MHRESIQRQVSGANSGAAAQPQEKGATWLVSRLARVFSSSFATRFSKPDFTHEDWKRVELGEKPAPCSRRDVINQYRWRI